MKLKKLFITFLAVAVMVAYMPATAFAQPVKNIDPRLSSIAKNSLSTEARDILETEAAGNLNAEVYLENSECKVADSIETVLRITDAHGNVVVEEELIYDEDYGMYSFDGNVEGVDGIIDAIAADYLAAFYDDESPDTIAIMENHGYSIEILMEDGDENHSVEAKDLDLTLINEEIFNETLDFLISFTIAFLEEEFEEAMGIEIEFVEVDGVEVPTVDGEELTFAKFVELYKAFLADPENEIDEEEAEEALAEIKAYEDMQAQFANGYKGQIMITADAECDCADLKEVVVWHEYYDAEDNMIDMDYDYFEVEEGTVINVEDIDYVTEYNGVKYQIEGVYEYDNDLEDVDYTNPITSFTVSDDYEVYVKYVPVKEGANDNGGAGTTDEGKDSADKNDQGKEENKGVETPETGDETPVALFVVLMAAAVVVMRKARA